MVASVIVLIYNISERTFSDHLQQLTRGLYHSWKTDMKNKDFTNEEKPEWEVRKSELGSLESELGS